MPDKTGTVERIAIELANALAQVPGRLRGDRLAETLADLGIGFPGAIPEGVVDAENTAAAAGEDVASTLQQLINAVGNGDETGIVVHALELIARFAQVVNGFVTLGNGLSAAGVAIPADFGQRLFDLFLIGHVDALPTAGNILTLLGVIERIEHAGTPGDPTQPPFTEQHIH